MKNEEPKAKFEIARFKSELFLLFEFLIFDSPFLALGAFVSLWQEHRARMRD